jgi:hypothetical protein
MGESPPAYVNNLLEHSGTLSVLLRLGGDDSHHGHRFGQSESVTRRARLRGADGGLPASAGPG